MKTYQIWTTRDQDICHGAISTIPLDGSHIVEIKKADNSSTGRQQRLRFKWFEEVAKSGLGKSDTKPDVELDAKWMFAKPIWLRDDPDMFKELHDYWMQLASEYRYTDPDLYSAKCRAFTEKYISIQDMNIKQHSEFLREFERYWIGKGVNLTNPRDYNVDLRLNGKIKP